MGKKIYFTVTNDLIYDQRMHRICSSLAANGYKVILVGRKLQGSSPLTPKTFLQKRIRCWFTKGRWFYREYNLRLFLFLLFKRMDAVCAIDLDTILPCLYVSKLKRVRRVYDAHELFTELKEVVTREAVQRAWTRIEKKTVPAFPSGYTVSESIAGEFHRKYGVRYHTIRNLPVLREWEPVEPVEKFILYQGAVNEARGFEWLIPALQWVNSKLVICGDGNFMPQLKELVIKYNLENKVDFRGLVTPDELWKVARTAHLGVAVAEKTGLNQYFALPNKFFDYIHAGLPQVTMDYPEYRKINSIYEVALLIDDLAPERIAAAINKLLADDVLHSRLRQNCLEARLKLNWQEEEKKLIAFYHSFFEK